MSGDLGELLPGLSGHVVLAHPLRYPVGYVAAGGRSDYRTASQPHGYGPPGGRNIEYAFARTIAEKQRGNETDKHCEEDDGPVDVEKFHGLSRRRIGIIVLGAFLGA